MGWLAALAVVVFAVWATLDVCQTLKRPRIEDSRPVGRAPRSHVRTWHDDERQRIYDQEGER